MLLLPAELSRISQYLKGKILSLARHGIAGFHFLDRMRGVWNSVFDRHKESSSPMKKFLKKARWILIPAALAAIVILWVVKFESQKPEIRPADDSPFLGRELTFRASDRKSGLAEVRVEAVQAGRTVETLFRKIPRGAANLRQNAFPAPASRRTDRRRGPPSDLGRGPLLERREHRRLGKEDDPRHPPSPDEHRRRAALYQHGRRGRRLLHRGRGKPRSSGSGSESAFSPDFRPGKNGSWSFSRFLRTRPATFLSPAWPRIRPATGRPSFSGR